MISQVLITSEQPKKNKMAFAAIVTNKVTLWAASSSACVVYTKTIIHLGVGESGGNLLVVVDVEIQPFAVLTIRIVQNEIYLAGSFFRFLWLWRFGLMLCQPRSQGLFPSQGKDPGNEVDVVHVPTESTR